MHTSFTVRLGGSLPTPWGFHIEITAVLKPSLADINASDWLMAPENARFLVIPSDLSCYDTPKPDQLRPKTAPA